MQPEVPAALARTGFVVVACWVLNAPVLLAIRVLGTCGPCCVRGAAQTARCPLVSRPPALTAACLPLAGAGASHLVSARSRSVPNPRSAPSRPVSLSRIRSMSVQLCSCRILLRVPCCPCGVSCCATAFRFRFARSAGFKCFRFRLLFLLLFLVRFRLLFPLFLVHRAEIA
jgi:hypothetical protein